MDDELKPCPFCGYIPELRPIVVYGNGEKSPEIVRCRHCHVSHASTEQGRAVAKWNTRHVEDALRAELEAVRRELALEKSMHEIQISVVSQQITELEAAKAEIEKYRVWMEYAVRVISEYADDTNWSSEVVYYVDDWRSVNSDGNPSDREIVAETGVDRWWNGEDDGADSAADFLTKYGEAFEC